MRFVVAVCAAALAAHRADAQLATVDEGSFTISRAGTAVGREQFRIRRTVAGDRTAEYVATATVALGDREVAPELRTDARGTPVTYRVEVRSGPATEERVKGAAERGLFTAVASRAGGESSRESVVTDGAVVLDADVFHHYYFVGRHAAAGAILVLVPRRGADLRLRVEQRGAESLRIGGESVAATHLVLRDAAGHTRDLWVDASGRVLRVALSDVGILAEREQLPR